MVKEFRDPINIKVINLKLFQDNVTQSLEHEHLS